MKERVSRLLASRAFIVVAVLLAIVLLLPSLRVGFMMDDYTQYIWLEGGPYSQGGRVAFWDMFRFQGADRATFHRSLDIGFWPWWSSPDLRLAFLRPVTALTHAIDHWLFRDSPALMRLESILMYGGVVAVVGAAYRRLLGPTVVAGLALLLYAIDDAHAVTVTWIANRNAVLAALFGIAALVMHDRAVKDGDRRARWIAPLLFAVGLLAGEAALGAGAYLFSYTVWLQKGKWTERARAFAPYVGVVVVWTALYKLGGYGAWGGEFYIDPGHEPARFAKAFAVRLPVLLHGQWSFPPSDMWLMVPPSWRWKVLPAIVIMALAGAVVLVFGLRKTNQNAFFATGMLLALVPVCATFPGDRLLMFSGFGAFGLMADFITAPRDGLPHARRLLVRGLSGFFIFLHLIAAPLLFAGRGPSNSTFLHEPIERVMASLPPSSELAGKTVVIVNTPDFLTAEYAFAARGRRGEARPERIRNLGIAVRGRAMLRRTGEKTVELTLSEGFFQEPFSLVFRRADTPVQLGDRWEVAGMVATVKAFTPDRKRAATVEFAFDEPVSGASFVWMTWQDHTLKVMAVPAVGEEVEVPVLDFATAMEKPKEPS
ncbi:MAG: hypothetical protein R3B70_06835 [Polyangiaceae bacterium]